MSANDPKQTAIVVLIRKSLQCTSLALDRQSTVVKSESLKKASPMKSIFASMAVVLTFYVAPALSAEFPKTGEAEYDTYYVDYVVAKIDIGCCTGSIVDETGITRNVKGEGPFHDMSVRCLYHLSVVGEIFQFNGSCVETDYGDNIFAIVDDKNHYLTGGTGKYKGITGTVSYTLVGLHETVGGRPALIVNHKAKWEIK
jgi:hypothetical protein